MRFLDSLFRLAVVRPSALALFLLAIAPSQSAAIGLPIVDSYEFTVTPQVRASSPTGPIDDLLNPVTETAGSFAPTSSFTSEGLVLGPPDFNSWAGDVLLRQLGQVSTGTSVRSGVTHRFEFDDIQLQLNDTQFVRSPIENITLPDWTVAATYHVVGTYYFGANAMPFDISGVTTATADHTNTSTVKQIRYLGALIVPLSTFSDGGVNYTPRIALSGVATVVPEPTTALLLGLGLVALACRRREAR